MCYRQMLNRCEEWDDCHRVCPAPGLRRWAFISFGQRLPLAIQSLPSTIMSALLRTSFARTALRATPASRRSLVTLKERLYEVEGIADSAGRNGTVTSPQSKSLTLKMSTPKSLGGAEDAHNPEQLFAMGYAGAQINAFRPRFI